MPQMMPLSWLMLFIMFSMTLILFATMNFYTSIPELKHIMKKEIIKKSMNWSW
uniref:ATP synthase F0 subunit 8 n=1 Tax=Neotermes insularis TaxID=105798 RepID=I6U2E6_9NEOP|nr:ATP synthase F0 subunit 8 [Neotermes insularis]AFM92438.1 ATP synthase F0 subunit 8 [Neotermes insularis]